jgi:predicted phosphate transport protein (TIGR00153 family)
LACFDHRKRLKVNTFIASKMFSLIPRDNSFFAMFSAMSDNLIAGAQTLVDLFANYHDVGKKIEQIHRIEREGDELTHAILTKLNQTFITPFDREDIHELASKLDDVLDFINASGARIVMYRITAPPSVAGELAAIILKQCQELQKAVSLMQKNGNILAHCVEINRLENEADLVAQQAIAKLFEGEKDPINLIKIKELLEFLERATDKAEDVANVLETVVLKNT